MAFFAYQPYSLLQEVNALKKAAQKIYDCKLGMALLLSGVSLVVLLALNRFSVIYATNDDYIMSILIQSGDAKNYFMNYFLTVLHVALQKFLPFVNWFSLLQILFSFVATTAVNFVLMKKQKGIEGFFFAACFDFLFTATVMVTVHWTQTTSMMCAAGFVLLFYALRYEQRKGCRIVQLILGCFLTVFGSLYRLVAFELSALVFALMCLCFFIRDMSLSLDKDKRFFKTFFKVFKSYLSLLICLVLVAGAALSADLASDKIKDADPNYQDYIDYTVQRSAVNDYKVPSYSGNEDFYHSIGITSASDLEMVPRLHTDKDFYTADRLRSIAEYAQAKGYGMTSPMKSALSFVKSEIKSRLHVENTTTLLLLLGIGGLVGLALLIVLFRFRNRLKFVFPVLLCGVWFVFLNAISTAFPAARNFDPADGILP